jgi:oligopeptidase A
MSNPLLERTDFVAYDKLKAEHFVPATDEVIKQALEIAEAIKSESNRTHTNTILESNRMSDLISEVVSPMSQLYSLMGSKDVLEAFAEVQQKLTVFSNNLSMDQEYYRAFKEFGETEEAKNLTGEKKRNYEEVMKGFKLSGADLSDEDKEKLKKINMDLSNNSMAFNNNVLASTYNMVIDNKDDLDGLPDDVVMGAREKFRQMNPDSKDEKWLFNLDYPSLLPFLKYSSKENLRKQLWEKNMSKAIDEGKDNRPIITEILKLKKEKAKILGFETYADLSLETKMAQSPTQVMDFLSDIAEKVEPIMAQEYEELKDFVKEESGERPEQIMPWSTSYWSNKLQEKKYSYNENEVREYFEINNTKEGLFAICNKIFGLTFKKEEGIPVWHKDVYVYSIHDEKSELRAYCYFDMHPRTGLKRPGAWMSGLRSGKNDEQGKVIPIVGVHCNFTEPVGDQPALLTYDEAQTFFHEFGHALHGALSKTELSSTAGTNVAWDTVELPSSFMENFVRNKTSLQLLAKHYKTGETMPEDLMDRLLASNDFQRAMFVRRQITFGMFDMTLHYTEALKDDPRDSHDVYREIHEKYSTTPFIENTYFETAFSHIFGGGYAAGYYSYMWANILDADAFSFFEENNDILSLEKGMKFRENILEMGNSEDMNVLFERFRGRAVSNKPLLKRIGIK